MKTMNILAVVLWITCVVTAHTKQPNCGIGWFGSSCQYMCHCQNNSTASDVDNCDDVGNCINGATCSPGWFGPACQYMDLAPQRWKKTSDIRPAVIDNNDTTCMAKQIIMNITVAWRSDILFSWLRIFVKKPELLHTFSLKFQTKNETLPCANETSSVVSRRSLDIHCDLDRPIKKVIISGKGVGYLCSMYISGGRNVALKQKTQPMGNNTNNFVPDKAVDGQRHTNCARINKNNPNWSVNLSGSPVVTRYVAFRKNGTEGHRNGFFLRSYNESSELVFTHRDKQAGWKTHPIIPTHVSRVSRVEVSINKAVVLCKIEIYGDSVCEQQKYGRDCEHSCNCAVQNETCFVSTGGCPSGCAVGYQGEACNQLCAPGTFGNNCSSSCSPFCLVDAASDKSPCHHIDGSCFLGCQDGYEGSTCLIEKSLLSEGSIIGMVAAMIIVIAAVTALLALYMRSRHARLISLFEKVTEQNDVHESSTRGRGYDEQGVLPFHEDITKHKQGGVQTDRDQDAMMYGPTSVAVKDLGRFLATHDRSFFQKQFITIPGNREATTTAAESKENKGKNRYKNVYPYDHSRVKLHVSEDKGQGDYINASYVEGYKPDEKFIATQGPSLATLEDFVRMLWEIRVDKLVMLTNLTENGKKKCERYWPEDDRMVFGEITISVSSVQMFAEYTIRRLHLKKVDEPVHSLTHFHFTAWPDRDIPPTTWGLVDFEQRVAFSPTERPIVVHCSAGIGRSGTFIALHNLMRQAEETGYVDCFTVIKKLRKDRIGMVQTFQQYEFLYRAAQTAMLCMNTTVMSSDITTRLQMLESKTDSTQTNMEKEFQMVCVMSSSEVVQESSEENPNQGVYENCKAADRRLKNRFGNIVPRDCHRAILQPELEGWDDYINAVLVPSVSDYLPSDSNETAHYAFFNIKTHSVATDVLWEEQMVMISIDAEMKTTLNVNCSLEEVYHVRHLKCKCHGLDTEKLLSLVSKIRSMKPSDEGRILYMCRNGSEYSGLVCVLSLLLDRFDSDRCLTVPLVVGALKTIQPAVIPTLDQYCLLYHAVKQYNEEISVYSNSKFCYS